jgi:hypothetical protein
MMKILSIKLAIVVTLIGTVVWWGKISWKQYIDEKYRVIENTSSQSVGYVDLQSETVEVPEIVKKYFYLVLTNGSPIIKRALVMQSGGFRAKPEIEEWSNMEAQQLFSTRPRAFIWNARITMIPGVSIDVGDSYVNGTGEMRGKLLSVFPLIDARSSTELNQGALQRYLAESVWFPTALLPSQGVKWKAMDASHALASISDSGITVSLQFEFNHNGEIVSVYTPNRYREISGKYVPTPWGGKLSHYTKINDYMIPQHGEVSWYLDDQVYTYWRAILTKVIYE